MDETLILKNHVVLCSRQLPSTPEESSGTPFFTIHKVKVESLRTIIRENCKIQ